MPSQFCNAHRNLLRFADACVLLASFLAADRVFPYIRPVFAPHGIFYSSLFEEFSPSRNFNDLDDIRSLLWVFALVLATTLFIMQVFRGYETFTRLTRARLVASCLFAPASGLAVVSVAFYAARFPGYSRVFVFTFIVLASIGLMTYRMLVHTIITHRFRRGVYSRETVLVGSAETVTSLANFFKSSIPETERRVVGYFTIGGSEPTATQTLQDIPYLGPVEKIGDSLIHQPIQDVVVVIPPQGAQWLNDVLRACDYFRISAHVLPEQLLKTQLTDIKALPTHLSSLAAVTFAPDEENGSAEVYFWKRLIDIVFSAAALVALSPLFAAIALAIKLTTPSLRVFYPWKVVGFRGRRFTGYKFTTMVADADDRKKDLLAQNEMTGPVFKIANDPRVTPLGRFLRKYSLNELPQFWSVLIGDMSLVGPRPAGPHELERYEMWHKRKLSVCPGITCFWQVRGRNAISNFDDWVRMDLEYIEKRSTLLDFKILLHTAFVVLRGTGC